jgi:hypothetical protein
MANIPFRVITKYSFDVVDSPSSDPRWLALASQGRVTI